MTAFRGVSLGDRVSSGSLPVIAGDLLAIFVFVGAGILRHGTVARLTDVVYIADTVAPFLVGWLVAALLTGAYTVAYESPTQSGLRAGGSWVLAAGVGQGLRASSLFHGSTTIAFVAVSVVVGGVLIVGWRVAYAVVGSTTAR